MMNLRALTLSEAHQATGISRRMLIKLITQGKLAGNRVGKNYIISAASLEAFVNHTPAPPSMPANDEFDDPENPFL